MGCRHPTDGKKSDDRPSVGRTVGLVIAVSIFAQVFQTTGLVAAPVKANHPAIIDLMPDGTPALMLGVPVLAKSGDAVRERVLFSHEYFHLYHDQVNHQVAAEPRALGHELWAEGLATYASSVISGDSDPVHLCYDADLARRYPGVVRRVAPVVLERYDSTSQDDRAAYFQNGRSPSAELPSPTSPVCAATNSTVSFVTRSQRSLAAMHRVSVAARLRERPRATPLPPSFVRALR